MGLSRVLDKIHQRLGRFDLAVRLAVKIRNQCDAVVKYHLGESIDRRSNGEKWLVDLLAPSCEYVVDVGANVGDWSACLLQANSKVGRVLCFEPSETICAQLAERFRNEPQVEVSGKGVGDRCEEKVLFEDEKYSELTSFVEQLSARPSISTPARKKVAMTTLDLAISQRGWPQVDLLKIDTEGYDYHVLRGATELLATQRVGVVQFEYGGAWAFAGSTLAAAVQFLESFRYECYLLKSAGLYPINYGYYGEYFSYSNYVAIAPCRTGQLTPFVR